MGLDTTHDCWHGSYGAFMWWRSELHMMLNRANERYQFGEPHKSLERAWEDGLYDDQSVPINVLMNHSDCDGEIPADVCEPLADTLQELVDRMPPGALYDTARPATERFIAGLRRAAAAGEAVGFH